MVWLKGPISRYSEQLSFCLQLSFLWCLWYMHVNNLGFKLNFYFDFPEIIKESELKKPQPQLILKNGERSREGGHDNVTSQRDFKPRYT